MADLSGNESIIISKKKHTIKRNIDLLLVFSELVVNGTPETANIGKAQLFDFHRRLILLFGDLNVVVLLEDGIVEKPSKVHRQFALINEAVNLNGLAFSQKAGKRQFSKRRLRFVASDRASK